MQVTRNFRRSSIKEREFCLSLKNFQWSAEKYSTYQNSMLAIMFNVAKWATWVGGSKIFTVTDNKNILDNTANYDKKCWSAESDIARIQCYLLTSRWKYKYCSRRIKQKIYSDEEGGYRNGTNIFQNLIWKWLSNNNKYY